jgi:hypothetical protein
MTVRCLIEIVRGLIEIVRCLIEIVRGRPAILKQLKVICGKGRITVGGFATDGDSAYVIPMPCKKSETVGAPDRVVESGESHHDRGVELRMSDCITCRWFCSVSNTV